MKGIYRGHISLPGYCKLFMAIAAVLVLFNSPRLYAGIGQFNHITPARVDIDTAELALESAAELARVYHHLNSTSKGLNLANTISVLYDFIRVLRSDIEAAGNGNFTLVGSQTIELIGKFTVSKIPDFVKKLQKAGILPKSFKLPATFGAEDFAAALKRHFVEGKVDIETFMLYLEGLNKAAWATAGFLIGGPGAAGTCQAIGAVVGSKFRNVAIPVVQKGLAFWTGKGNQLVNDWKTAQYASISKGLPVKPISVVYKRDTLAQNGINTKHIQELDVLTHDINRKHIAMKKDLKVEKVANFVKTGNLKLGGVTIDPELVYVGELENAFKELTIKSRPSEASLYWPVEIPD